MLERKPSKRLSYLRESICSQVQQNATLKKWRSIGESLQRETSRLYRSLPNLPKTERGILKRDLKPLLKSFTLRKRASSELKSRSSIESFPLSRENFYQRRRESMKETLERLGSLKKHQQWVRRQTSENSGLAEQLDVWDSDELRGNQGDLTARTLARSHHHDKSGKGGRKVTFSTNLSPIAHTASPTNSTGALHGQAVSRVSRQVPVSVNKSSVETSSSSTSLTESAGKKIRLSLTVPAGNGTEVGYMMTSWLFLHLVLCEGNPPVTGGIPLQSKKFGALLFSLLFAWRSCRIKSRVAADLRHNDVRMTSPWWSTEHTIKTRLRWMLL